MRPRFSLIRFVLLVCGIIFTFVPEDTLTLLDVTIIGHDNMTIWMRREDNETCVETVYIRNNNPVSVNVTLSDGKDYETYEMISYQQMNISVRNITTINVTTYIEVNVSRTTLELITTTHLTTSKRLSTTTSNTTQQPTTTSERYLNETLLNSNTTAMNITTTSYTATMDIATTDDSTTKETTTTTNIVNTIEESDTSAHTTDTSQTNIGYIQVTDYLVKNLSVLPRPFLQGLTLTGPAEMAVNMTPSFMAEVTDGVEVRFQFNISYYKIATQEWIPMNANVNTGIYSANVSFSAVYYGDYKIEVRALSTCNEILEKEIRFKASYPIHQSVAVSTIKAYDHRPSLGDYFYPHDTVGIALKVVNYINNYSNYTPTDPSCIVDWGDDGNLTTDYVDLTPDPVTHFTYAVNYSYSQIGKFKASVICQNTVSQVQSSIMFQVLSPVLDASAVLVINPVPFPLSGKAEGSVKIIQNYLNRTYDDLFITVDFGVENSTETLTYSVESEIVTYTYTHVGNYPVSVTFDSFNTTTDYLLNIRIGALIDFYQVKNRSYIRYNEVTTFKIIRFISDDDLNVTLILNPGGPAQIISFENGTEYRYIDTIYTDIGIKRAAASVNLYGITEVMYYDFETYIPCISTIDLFESTYREEDTPLEAWLSTLPKISGRAERTSACNESDQFYMTWKIWRNDGVTPNDTWTTVNFTQPDAIVMDFIFITLPGLYKLELNISVIGKREKESDTMFLKVSRAPLMAIISKGTFRQIKAGIDFTVDAASESYDPPLKPLLSGLKFSWSCYKLSQKEDITRYALPYYHNDTSYRKLKNCRDIITPMSVPGRITIQQNTVKPMDLILFEVIVTKDSRSEIATQVIEVLNAELCDVYIKCLWNCERKLSTNDRTVLTFNCDGCGSRDIYEANVRWSVFKYDPETFSLQEIPENYWNSKIITSSRYSTRFDTEGSWWEDATTYTIMVAVTISKCVETVAMKVVFTNIKPNQGTCNVFPTQGKATNTVFSFKCLGWKDEGIRAKNSSSDTNFGLQYAIFQKTSAGSHLVYFGSEIQVSTMLSECSTSTANCEVIIKIIDIFRARVDFPLLVTIEPNYQQASNTGNANDIFVDMHRKMNSSKSVRDFMKIAKRAATLSSSLSSLNAAANGESGGATTTTTTTMSSLVLKQVPKSEISKTANGFVEVVGGIIQKLHSRSTEEVQILANSMSVVTKDKEIMTIDSVDTASGAISRLASTLQNLTDPKLPDLNPCLNEITDAVHNIVEYQAINMSKIYSDIMEKAAMDGLSDLETEILIEAETKKIRFQVHNQYNQILNIVNNLTSSWDGILQVFPKMEDPVGVFNKLKQSYSMTTQKATLADVKNTTTYNSTSGFTFDDIDVDDSSSSDLVVKTVKTKNIYIHGPNSRFINQDIIIGSVGYEDKVGTKLNITNPKVIHETLDSNCSNQEINLEKVNPTFIEGDAAGMFYHQFEYPQTHLHICLKLRPKNPLLSFTLYLRLDTEPTDLAYDIIKPLTPDMFKPCEEICFPPNTLKKSGTVFVGLKPSLDKTEMKSASRLKKREASTNLNDMYHFGVTTSACFSWNETIKDWMTNNCRLTKEKGNVICSCESGNNIISALSFNFQPNAIHFSTVFSRFDIKAQGIVFGVLVSLYLVFAILCFWAHYMDKKGIFQWGVFPLVDNYAYESYFYLITVHTGLRKSAGTKSKVFFCLYGEDDETGVRKLSDGIKEGFPTGSVYHFVMACPKCLGELQCLKIWHDNSGKGNEAPWFLDRIDIVDIQTRKAYYFICEEWLAAEYTVETAIEATSVNELENLKNMFLANTKQHLTDDHVWLSVFIRPDNSPFSRVERTACCLAFFLLAMITSAMFYKGAPDTDRQQPKVDFEIGPLRIGYQQLYNSFLSALITTIPMMLVVTIFRKVRTQKDSDTCLCKNKVKGYGDEEITKSGDPLNKEFLKDKKHFQCKLPWMVKLEQQLKSLEKILVMRPDTEELQKSWPQPLRYIAWIIIAIAVVASSFFVILYSMEWGKDITEQWLTTFILAFLQSLFVLDPFKVIVVSVVLALLVKKVKMKGLDELDLSLISQVNKEYGLKQSKSRQEQSDIWTIQTEPPTKLALERATLRRKIHIMIKNTLQECLIHCVYLLIISSLCYSNRSNNAYLLYKVVSDQLLTDTSTGFLKINSSEQYFNWTSNMLIPWLFSDLKRDKIKKNNLDTTVNEEILNIYLMGAARIRQLRIQKENCYLYGTEINDCVPGYSLGREEKTDFCLGWHPKPCSEYEDFISVSSPAWLYKSAQDVWGLPIAGIFSIYSGGGYIVKLNVNSKTASNILKELRENLWIDHQTRAVFHEFTVYSPNINYFAFVILLAEYTETGDIVPFFNIYPYTVYNPPGLLGTYVQLCQVTGIVLTVLGIMYIVFILGKKKWTAFKDPWFLLDFSAIITALCGVIMFFLRLSFTKSALNKLKENKHEYINFYHIVFWDSSYILCLAMLVAIGYFRLLKLASYSEKTMKVYIVLTKAVRIFPGYFFFVFLLLLGFIGMGFAFFGCTSYYFKDILTTAESLFTGVLGRSSFRDTNVPYSDHWTTTLYFCLFVGIVVIFLMNYFLAVLMDLLTAEENRSMFEESSKISMLLWDSFLKLLGRKVDPIDRMKDAIEVDTESSEEEETTVRTKRMTEEDIIMNLESKFYRLMNEVNTTLSKATKQTHGMQSMKTQK